MKNKILIVLISLTGLVSFSQKSITWEDLSKVEFTEKFYPSYDQNFLEPKFSESVKALEGELIMITGYFLNIDPNEKMYILSKGPMASCFFCGIGGPETAMELQFKSKPKFKTDDIIVVTGKLVLNKDDIEHFNYILTECEGQL